MPHVKALNPDKTLQAYVIGLALGDGNLSNPNGRATRLRLTCDAKYPLLLLKIMATVQELLPDNNVALVKRQGCMDVSVYSNQLSALLGWKDNGGSKFKQDARVPEWIKDDPEYATRCLVGLLQTDGAIYVDRGYQMVTFANTVEHLADDVYEIISSLGFEPHYYRIARKTKLYNFNQLPIYHVRLSKNVESFSNRIDLHKV